MKRMILLALVSAVSLLAQTRGVGLEMGYTSADFREVNNMLGETENDLQNFGYGVDKEEFGPAFYLAVSYDHPVRSQFVVGPKLEYVRLFSTEMDANQSGASWKSVRSAWLVPLLVGGRYYLPVSSPDWSIAGGGYLGYAFGGTLEDVERTNFFGSNADYEVPASGSGWMIELGLNGERRLTYGISLVLGLEYRLCDIDAMVVSKDVDVPRFQIGDGVDLEDGDGRDIHFDYSGVKIGLGIKIRL